jgi:hypothetical protein
MGIFRKRPHTGGVPDESTQDRALLKRDAVKSLRRAEDLKKRSSAVAADLTAHGQTNHYIERLREAWGAQ